MDAGEQPTLDEVEGRFTSLIEGRLTRAEADRWAFRWVSDDRLAWDDISWWALNLLCGIDLPADECGYLHDDEQVRGWLAELRKRRMV